MQWLRSLLHNSCNLVTSIRESGWLRQSKYFQHYYITNNLRFSKDDLFEGYKDPMLAVLFVSPTKTKVVQSKFAMYFHCLVCHRKQLNCRNFQCWVRKTWFMNTLKIVLVIQYWLFEKANTLLRKQIVLAAAKMFNNDWRHANNLIRIYHRYAISRLRLRIGVIN